MKVFILVALLTGCATERDYSTVTRQVPDYGIEAIYVKKAQAWCMALSDKDNIAFSCVKDK